MGISARLVWFFPVIFEGSRLGTKNEKVQDGLHLISISVSDRNSTHTQICACVCVCVCVCLCVGGGVGGRGYCSTLTLKNLLRDTLQKAVKKLKCTYQSFVYSVGSCDYQHLVLGDPRPFN